MDDDHLRRIHCIPDTDDVDAHNSLADVQPMLCEPYLVPNALRASYDRRSRCAGRPVPNPGGHHQHPVDAYFQRRPKPADRRFADVLLLDHVSSLIRTL
jgi:hypothetical protein